MNTKTKDLNLLSVFAALMAERNVSKAAKRLALSQPAMSHALARLRRDFGDDLFVRTGRGIAPTPKALAMANDVDRAIEAITNVYAESGFDPAAATGKFVVATTDYLELVLLPKLLAQLSREARHLTPVVRSTLGALPKTELEAGTIDLAIAGFYGDLPEGFYAQTLFDETYTCIIRKDHPRARGKLSLETFLDLDHVLVSPQGDLDGIVDKELAKKKLKRRIIAGVSNFQTPATIIAGSDCIATLPTRIAEQLAQFYPLRCFAPPLPIPSFRVKQVWHARTHRDPRHAWVRRAIESSLSGR